MFNEKLSPLGVFLGFIVVVVTSIVLSLLSLVIFSNLITKNAPLNILEISTGPLIYSLAVIVISVISGIFVTANTAKYNSIYNAIGVVTLYVVFTYLLSQSPSNVGKYPQWYVIAGYVVLIPALIVGHFSSNKINKNT
jgi:hypothetical protein